MARQLKRNPTSVECFDVAQSNSEHSRHWCAHAGLRPIDARRGPFSSTRRGPRGTQLFAVRAAAAALWYCRFFRGQLVVDGKEVRTPVRSAEACGAACGACGARAAGWGVHHAKGSQWVARARLGLALRVVSNETLLRCCAGGALQCMGHSAAVGARRADRRKFDGHCARAAAPLRCRPQLDDRVLR